MATILDPSNIRCAHGHGGRVVALGRKTFGNLGPGPWRLFCQEDIDFYADDEDIEVVFIHFDATRQRRSNPDQHDPPEDPDHDPTDVGYWIDGRRP